MAEKKGSGPRYLTKSRYKLALECPAKLFYAGKPEYADQMCDDPFMEGLAEGGFQVGELAKLYFPEGVEVKSRGIEEAVSETNELLKKDKVTIFEAAVRFGSFFIRADILKKRGDHVDLIEVKAKSIDMEDEKKFFTGKKGLIRSVWLPYLKDAAFQKYVTGRAFPKFEISAYLMLADKNTLSPTGGLNQKFKVVKDGSGRKSVHISDRISEEDLSVRILIQAPVDEYCRLIHGYRDAKVHRAESWEKELKWYAESCERDEKIDAMPSSACRACRFKASPEDREAGLKSGFEECLKKMLHFTDRELEEPTVFDGWYFNATRFIEKGVSRMKDVEMKDLNAKAGDKPGLSRSRRQWLQVEKVKNRDDSVFIDRERLKDAISKFKFPLHFIDFETTRVAIPFTAGRSPYEAVAFQFSHHTLDKDGKAAHRGEYLNAEPGVFPNYDFARELKKQLEEDSGSIFMYASHENSILCAIHDQLIADSSDIPDRDALIKFIKSITAKVKDKAVLWKGGRAMIDLKDLLIRFYYDPRACGSNSLKDVLPAVLSRSKFLQDKYSEPVYGAKGGIPSKNFTDKRWLVIEGGEVADPYRQLPKLFKDFKGLDLELLTDSDEITDGGAAMLAYGKLQFEEMSGYEREQLKSGLLKYCELDTLAMVMLYEAWREMLGH